MLSIEELFSHLFLNLNLIALQRDCYSEEAVARGAVLKKIGPKKIGVKKDLFDSYPFERSSSENVFYAVK